MPFRCRQRVGQVGIGIYAGCYVVPMASRAVCKELASSARSRGRNAPRSRSPLTPCSKFRARRRPRERIDGSRNEGKVCVVADDDHAPAWDHPGYHAVDSYAEYSVRNQSCGEKYQRKLDLVDGNEIRTLKGAMICGVDFGSLCNIGRA